MELKSWGRLWSRTVIYGLFVSSAYIPSWTYATELDLSQLETLESWQLQQQAGLEWLADKQLSAEQRAELLLTLSRLPYQQNNFRDALKFLTLLEQHTSANKLSDNYFKALKLQGICHFYLGQYQDAIDLYERALAVAQQRQNAIEIANLRSNLGLAFFKSHTLDQALAHFLEADALYQQYGDAQDQADILLNISGVYIRQAAYDKAEEMLQTALQAFGRLGDEYGEALAQADLGVLYTETQRPELARASYQAAIDYYEQQNDIRHLSYEYVNLSKLSYSLNALEEAEKEANFALYYGEKANNPANLMEAYFALAKVLFAQSRLTPALDYAQQSLALSQQLGEQRKESASLRLLALIAAATGDIALSRDYHQQYLALQRRLMRDSVQQRINDYRAKYEASELSREVESLKQAQKLQSLKEQQKSQLLMLSAIIGLLTLLSGFALYRRRAEQQAKLELTKKVAERTAQLQQKADELKTANSVKSQFLANMSHEIRTPLTTVLGHAEDLLTGHTLTPEATHAVKVMHAQGCHLRDLVSDILDLSKIEAERLELESSEFLLSSLLADLSDTFQQSCENKSLDFIVVNQLDDNACVRLDYIRVKQILINLLSNALKFTETGRIELHLTSTQQGLAFTVIDTGIGMNEQQVARIFDSFQQADNSITRRFGGSGLGLSLSNKLAQMMAGDIHVTSAPGQGSTFTFALPCHVYRMTESDFSDPTPGINEPLNGSVLIVEDHVENRQLFARMVASYGPSVSTAENGKQAVELCLSQFPDLVLMDIQMPDMDGLEALKILRAAGYNQSIYALTANVLSNEVQSYIAAGFNGHIGKPFTKKELLAVLKDNLQVAEQGELGDIQVDLSDLRDSFASTFEQERYLAIDAWQNEDWQALQGLCHKLAGAATMFDFTALATVAKSFEQALVQQNAEQYQSLFLALCDELGSNSATAISD